jgi:sulfite reductase beta subunit-like hemoprotein
MLQHNTGILLYDMSKDQSIIKEKDINKKEFVALPSVGDYLSRQEWEKACWQKLSKSNKLLGLLMTSHERRDLVMRAAIIKGIVSGKSYRQISKELFVSL